MTALFSTLYPLIMKKICILLSATLLLFSCKEKENGGNGDTPSGEIASLSELLDVSGPSSTEFDFTISGLVVTAVYENYAQLEDGTSGAQLNKAGHGLTVGQQIDGRISGRARNTSGALFLSELNTDAAHMSTVPSLPETKTTLAEVLADKGRYTNRRIRLENITFVNGFNGAAGGSGAFSQQGVQIPATCRPADIIIPDGWQGDLICYPSAAACYVFSADDFIRHDISTPIAEIGELGVYASASSHPRAVVSYRRGNDQYAWGKNADEREFRLQNYDEEWVLLLRFPLRYKLGQELSLTTETIGTDVLPSGKSKVFVEKLADGQIWLMDYDSDMGYVLKITED